MYEPHNDREPATRGTMVAQFCGWASVLSVVALIALHVPHLGEAPNGAPVLGPHASAPAPTAYYFPSQYQLNAPDETGEQAPTF